MTLQELSVRLHEVHQVIEVAMNGDAFEPYIKTQLAPTLKKGNVVVLDNLPVHKRKEDGVNANKL